jgi:hypothetical protein
MEFISDEGPPYVLHHVSFGDRERKPSGDEVVVESALNLVIRDTVLKARHISISGH